MSGEDDELVARAEARLGAVLRGKYRLDRVLGIGGMATVYAATHRNGNEFAVKMLHADLSMRAEIRSRFLREGHAAGSVKHPGAVQVLDDDVSEDGSAFLVMELLRGESIETLWERRRQRLPLKLVVAIGIQLLDVLEAAHGRGVIHRDIKPANIFLTHTGHLKVLDFGIARVRDMTLSQATQTGTMLGTPAFMAPEQAMAKTSEIDAQSDVWAAGATMFTLACGKLVHDAENAQQIMIRAATTPAPPFSEVFEDAPPLIAEVIDRALAFEKSERWSSAAAMRDALRTSIKSVFGMSATPEAVADIIAELGEEATVVKSFDLPPPHPGLQPHAVGPSTEDTTVPAIRGGSKPVMIRGAPIAELATAQPVFSDTPKKPLQLSRRRLPRGLTLALLSTAVVAGGGFGLLVFLTGPRSTPGPSLSSSVQVAPSVTLATAPSAALTPQQPSAMPATAAAPSASIQVVPFDELPTAPAATSTAALTTRTPTPAAPANKPNCKQPFTYDAQGNRMWKRECINK